MIDWRWRDDRAALTLILTRVRESSGSLRVREERVVMFRNGGGELSVRE